MLKPCTSADLNTIYEIINDAAVAYKGIIPADRWHEPYMPMEELKGQMEDGVKFWCYKNGDDILGVMGIQDRNDVTLIRHAYVRTTHRNKGIGGALLKYLRTLTDKPVLIGTWSDAKWAIDFYLKNGFRLLSLHEKNKLLVEYWSVPQRQIDTSVVLADDKWNGDRD